jgi:O-antigen/teichoic acid export membrane protein
MNSKALAKGVAKISFVILILFLVGFFVFSYVLPVFANTHTSSAVITPSWVKCGTYATFTVIVTHTGNPGDDPII